MINKLIEEIASALKSEMHSDGTLRAFKKAEYANDLNNVAASPCVRFYLTQVSLPAGSSYSGMIEARFSFIFYTSGAGGSIQQIRKYNNSLLWSAEGAGIIPFFKKLPAFVLHPAGSRWQIANYTPFQFLEPPRGTASAFGIITDVTFNTYYK